MKRRHNQRVMAVGMAIAALLVAAPALAQAPTPMAITMDEALRLAVERAPRVAEARAHEAAAESSVSALKKLALPSASIQSEYMRLNDVTEFRIPDGTGGSRVLYPNIPNLYRARLDVMAPIYSFGRVSSNVAAADADVIAAGADRRVAESDTRLDVLRAYWSLATAREAVKVLTESLARTDAQVEDVRARVESGFLAPSDLQSTQAQRARQYVRLLQARNESSLAELDLARLIGAAPGSPIQLTSAVDQALPKSADLLALPAEELIARALRQRGERAGLVARGEGLRQQAKATRANLNPYATAQASLEGAKPNTRYVPPIDEWRDSWTLDIKFVWPLFDSGRTKAQAATFVAQANAVDARRDELDGLVSLEVRQRLLDVQFGREAIAASDQAVAAAAEARRVLNERFLAGVATSTEVLDAQVALLDAQLERTRLSAGLRLSEARLLHAIGEQ
jgi:outer membrane protein